MRGRYRAVCSRSNELRFIPAYAGQIRFISVMRISRRVHPRVCGADKTVADNPLLVAGSSPRMRGRYKGLVPETPHYRFIPAYAGQMAVSSPYRLGAAVHPRVCGADSDILWLNKDHTTTYCVQVN